MAFVPMAGTRKCTSESWETSKTIFARPRGIRIFWRSTRQLPWTAGKLWMLVAQFSDFLCYFLFMTLSCSVRHVFVFWKFKCAYICIYIYTRVCVCLLFSYVESSPISQDSYRSMIIRTAPCLGVCQHWFAWVFMACWKRYWIPVLFCPWISSYDTCDSFFMLFLCCRLQTIRTLTTFPQTKNTFFLFYR